MSLREQLRRCARCGDRNCTHVGRKGAESPTACAYPRCACPGFVPALRGAALDRDELRRALDAGAPVTEPRPPAKPQAKTGRRRRRRTPHPLARHQARDRGAPFTGGTGAGDEGDDG